MCMRAGEINTLQGNLNWMASREHSLKNEVWHGREEELLPVCNSKESDSANLDHVAEIMMRTGVDPCEALMVLVPEAYHNHPELSKNYPEVRPSVSAYPGTELVQEIARLSLHHCQPAATARSSTTG